MTDGLIFILAGKDTTQVKTDISANPMGRDVTHAGLLINPGERDIEANCQFFGSKEAISALVPVLANRLDLLADKRSQPEFQGRQWTFIRFAHICPLRALCHSWEAPKPIGLPCILAYFFCCIISRLQTEIWLNCDITNFFRVDPP